MSNRFSLDDKKRGNCASYRINKQNRHFCYTMEKMHEMCGTKYCPFYKPRGCEDWIRIERLDTVEMWPPEERRAYWRNRDVFEHDEI